MPSREFWFDSVSRALEKSTEECRDRISKRLKIMAEYPDETVSAEIALLRGYIGNVLIESQSENGRKHISEEVMGQEAIKTDLVTDFLENHCFPNLSPDLVSLYYFIARRQDGALSSEEIEIVESVRRLLSSDVSESDLRLEQPSPDDYVIPTQSSPEIQEFMVHLGGCIRGSNACEACDDAYKTIVKGFTNGIVDEKAYAYSFRVLATLGTNAQSDPQCLYKKIDFLLSYLNVFLPTLSIKDIAILLQNLVKISYESENRTECVSLLLDSAGPNVYWMQWTQFQDAVSLLRNCIILGITGHPTISSLVEKIHEHLVLIRSLSVTNVREVFHDSAFDMLHKVMILHPDLFDSNDVKLVREKALVMERPSTKTPSVDRAGELIREILNNTCTIMPYHIDNELGLEYDIFIAGRNAQKQVVSLDIEMDGSQHDFSKLEDDFKDRISMKRGIAVVRIKNNEIYNIEKLRQKLTEIFRTKGLPIRASQNIL